MNIVKLSFSLITYIKRCVKILMTDSILKFLHIHRSSKAALWLFVIMEQNVYGMPAKNWEESEVLCNRLRLLFIFCWAFALTHKENVTITFSWMPQCKCEWMDKQMEQTLENCLIFLKSDEFEHLRNMRDHNHKQHASCTWMTLIELKQTSPCIIIKKEIQFLPCIIIASFVCICSCTKQSENTKDLRSKAGQFIKNCKPH